MTHGSLFSGIGGFDLAAEWSGFENIFNCEWEEFPRQVLKHHFPNAKQYEDIHDFDATEYNGRIDILSGGFPCQPFSVAGKQEGSDDPRHLWPEMLRIVRESNPTWVVGENVFGFTSWSNGMVFESCCSDLENLGYSVQSFVIPACAVGCNHRRDRCWIIAHSDNARANNSLRNNSKWKAQNEGREGQSFTKFREGNGDVADPKRFRLEHPTKSGSVEESAGKTRQQFASTIKTNGSKRDATNSDSNRLEGSISSDKYRQQQGSQGSVKECLSTSRQTISLEGFPTEPPICGGDDGLSEGLDKITFSKWRKEGVKAYGNAIVPQIAFNIFQTIVEFEKNNIPKSTNK
jgi:DNA (cytosine-5)-methyltransferase 1